MLFFIRAIFSLQCLDTSLFFTVQGRHLHFYLFLLGISHHKASIERDYSVCSVAYAERFSTGV